MQVYASSLRRPAAFVEAHRDSLYSGRREYQAEYCESLYLVPVNN